MRAHRAIVRILAAAVVAAAVASTVEVALAAFGAQAANSGNGVAAAPDYRAPVVSAVAVGKAVGGTTGFVRQGASYYVYANVAADTGNPASGVASVRADVANLTTAANSSRSTRAATRPAAPPTAIAARRRPRTRS